MFSKTVFSISRSTFRIYSVMAVFNSSIVWGLFSTVIIRCTETFYHPVLVIQYHNLKWVLWATQFTTPTHALCAGPTLRKERPTLPLGLALARLLCTNYLPFMLVMFPAWCCRIASVPYKSLITWESIVIQAHVIRGRQQPEFFQESLMAILSPKLPVWSKGIQSLQRYSLLSAKSGIRSTVFSQNKVLLERIRRKAPISVFHFRSDSHRKIFSGEHVLLPQSA